MRILIATGIYPPDIGGPAQYAQGIEEAWRRGGNKVEVVAFSRLLKLPTGIRHLCCFFRVLFSLRAVAFVFSPDTFSAALPALCASKLAGKKFIVRMGGDFLWEQYVERAGDLVLLRQFYQTCRGRLNLKERLIFMCIRFLFRHADAAIFSTAWQRDIFREPYGLDVRKCFIVENYYGPRVSNSIRPYAIAKNRKVFVGGARPLRWKNLARAREAFEKARERGIPAEISLRTGSRAQFLLDIQSCYAVIVVSLGDVSPNTILEAVQFGKPFILTRETGLYGRLKDIGVWVDPEDVNDIAAKIEWLCDERNYQAQVKKIQAFAFTHAYEEIAGEIFAIYRKI